METAWMMAQMHLYELVQAHPEWSVKQLATQLGYSESWVKKWKKRFREAGAKKPGLFCSQSRAPKTHTWTPNIPEDSRSHSEPAR